MNIILSPQILILQISNLQQIEPQIQFFIFYHLFNLSSYRPKLHHRMIINFKSKLIPLFANSHKLYSRFDTNQSNLLAQSLLNNQSQFHFSTYFSQLDKDDIQSYSQKKYQNKKYRALINLWKKPLQRKRKRQQRIKQIKQSLPTPKLQSQKLVLHNSAVGIEYPPAKNQIFCVIKVDGFQYKVSQDSVVILDTKQDHEINKTIKFNQILLAGTKSYTVLGRPFLENTYVEGVIQSISDSQKTIVFKKKRRKQYKKSYGSRVKLTSLRITKISHELTQQTLSHAVSLVDHTISQKLSLTQ